MPLKLWTYDVAREQCPSPAFLDRLASETLEAGYDGIGLYLEHRFAYPSAPWAHGVGVITPEDVARLRRSHPSLRIVPFVNLLGHTEGFLYTERGKRYAEERFKGLQACPSNGEFQVLAASLLDDVLNVFDDEIVHLGGDETAQLGLCPVCSGKSPADLYQGQFAPLCERIKAAGKRPAVWGDMMLEHSEVDLPRDTLVFDWQYFASPLATSKRFVEAGYEVVCCPTLHTYNSTWLNAEQAQQNVRDAQAASSQIGAGFCLTTWECGLFGNYGTLLPAIKWAAHPEGGLADAYDGAREWFTLMGERLVDLGGMFAAGRIRSSLKCRLLLYGNPFLAWLHHHEELGGPAGDAALEIARRAIQVAPDADYRGVAVFLEKAIEFVRYADQARQAYAQELPGIAVSALAPCRQLFDDLERVAVASNLNAGGSLADVARCRQAKSHVETVVRRLRDYGAGQLGYLPAFEAITHSQFCPHDQGCWWRINTWANE